MKGWHKAALAWAGLGFLILLFLYPALPADKVLLPLDLVQELWPPWQQPNQPVSVHNPLLSDVVDYIFPVKAFTAETVKSGQLPLWNPYVLGGYPATYNTQAGLFYPLSALYYLLPPVTAVDLVIVVQMFLGAAFMFAFLRRLQMRLLAAFMGAVIFTFNGLMVVWLEWQVVHAAIIWLPLQLLLIEQMALLGKEWADNRRRVWRTAVYLALAFAVPWLGGHWNWTLYGSMTAVLYGLWRFGPICLAYWRGKQRDEAIALGSAALAALLLGAGLALVQVLPAFNYLRQGHRQALAWSESLDSGLLNEAVVALVPDFWGTPLAGTWYGSGNYNESTFYLGLLPWLLLPLAWQARQRRQAIFFGGWGLLGMLWTLGTPAYGLLYVLPVFDGLLASRAAVVVVFCLSVLAAMGLDALAAQQETAVRGRGAYRAAGAIWLGMPLLVLGYWLAYRPEWPVVADAMGWFALSWLVSGGLFYLAGKRAERPFLWRAGLVVWVIVDLFVLGFGYNTVGDVAALYPQTETAVFLQQEPELFRMATLPRGVAYPPNSFLPDRLQSISGYEPAILARLVNYLELAEGGESIYFERKLMPLRGLTSPLLDVLNVKYIVTITDWFAERSEAALVQMAVADWEVLAGETAVEQTITLPAAGFHRVDFQLRAAPEADGTVVVRVWTADGGQELANASLAVEALQTAEAGTHSFFFGAFPSEWGREFVIRVVHQGQGRVEIGATAAGELALAAYYLPRPQLVAESGKTRIYLNQGYFQRAFWVPRALTAVSEEEALALVAANSDRLDEVVVVETEGQPPPPPTEGQVGDHQVQVRTYELNRVVVDVDTAVAGFVVLGDSYYPGWQARLDDDRVPLYRANSVMRAVFVPAGQYELVFSFHPPDFYAGAAASLLALLLCSVILLKTRGRRST